MKYKRRFRWSYINLSGERAQSEGFTSAWDCMKGDYDPLIERSPLIERRFDGKWYIGPGFWLSNTKIVLTPSRPGPYRTLNEAIAAYETLAALDRLPVFQEVTP